MACELPDSCFYYKVCIKWKVVQIALNETELYDVYYLLHEIEILLLTSEKRTDTCTKN